MYAVAPQETRAEIMSHYVTDSVHYVLVCRIFPLLCGIIYLRIETHWIEQIEQIVRHNTTQYDRMRKDIFRYKSICRIGDLMYKIQQNTKEYSLAWRHDSPSIIKKK